MVSTNDHHILLVPFLAQGHIFPFLSLADLLHRRCPLPTTITVVTTPLNAKSIISYLPAGSPIVVLPLPFHGPDHGLPPDAENTDSLPYPLISRLFLATSSLLPHLNHHVSNTLLRKQPTPQISIIADVFCGWTVVLARKYGFFHSTFTTCGAFGSAAFMSLWVHLPHKGKRDDEEFTIPGFPDSFKIRRNQLSMPLKSVETSDEWLSVVAGNINLALTSRVWLCNTTEELEPAGMLLLRKITKASNVFAVGPLFLAGRKTSEDKCIKWLDTHRRGSVLYVAFGSMNTIKESQMMALAKGLEASGQAFLWVVRPPIGHDLKEEFRDEWLPVGFEERLWRSGRGMLVRNWAPQLEILSHPAVGGFLSHCGWNSTMESLRNGVPMIGWPIAGEQFYNSKMMEDEMGVCVEIARGVTEEVEWVAVEKVVRSVMEGKEGDDMRRRAVMVKAALAEGSAVATGETSSSQLRTVDEFLALARSNI